MRSKFLVMQSKDRKVFVFEQFLQMVNNKRSLIFGLLKEIQAEEWNLCVFFPDAPEWYIIQSPTS